MMRLLRTLILMMPGLLTLLPGAAAAHRPSDAFLSLQVTEGQIEGQWEIALRDLDAVYALDSNGDGELTWGELRTAQARLAAELTQRLRLRLGEQTCLLDFHDLLVNTRTDGPYAWFALRADCGAAAAALDIEYELFFRIDPSHRGLLRVGAGPHLHAAVLSPDRASTRIVLAQPSLWNVFADYLREGVHHIWIGIDHILFLLVLLLPCVLVRASGRWQPAQHLRPVLWDVLAVVTAFTVAHSITLTMAALGWVQLSSTLVESVIALSVLLSALNNIVPRVIRRRWLLAFGFGLLHGFGFASVLGELGLPQGTQVLALLAFNLGVELGQLAIVAAAVPLAFALRKQRIYSIGILQVGSGVIAVIALIWFLQRTGLLEF